MAKVQRYLERISGPLLDRIDLIIEVPRVAHQDLRAPLAAKGPSAITSAQLRRQVQACRELQMRRCAHLNKDLGLQDLEDFCALDSDSELLFGEAVEKLMLTAQATHRVLKIARTIADLEARESISVADLFEAIAYRRQARLINVGT